MLQFNVRITLDAEDVFEADDEEKAVDLAWEKIMNEGDYGVDVTEVVTGPLEELRNVEFPGC